MKISDAVKVAVDFTVRSWTAATCSAQALTRELWWWQKPSHRYEPSYPGRYTRHLETPTEDSQIGLLDSVKPQTRDRNGQLSARMTRNPGDLCPSLQRPPFNPSRQMYLPVPLPSWTNLDLARMRPSLLPLRRSDWPSPPSLVTRRNMKGSRLHRTCQSSTLLHWPTSRPTSFGKGDSPKRKRSTRNDMKHPLRPYPKISPCPNHSPSLTLHQCWWTR